MTFLDDVDDPALDLYDYIGDLANDNEFERIDRLLEESYPSYLGVDVCLGVLRTTFKFKASLQCRESFYQRVLDHFKKDMGEKVVHDLFGEFE